LAESMLCITDQMQKDLLQLLKVTKQMRQVIANQTLDCNAIDCQLIHLQIEN